MRVDLVADVLFCNMHALSPGRTDHRVVVQRRDDLRPVAAGQRRQIEREVQQVVDVDHVRTYRPKHVVDAIADERRTVGLAKRTAPPVVRDFDDRQAFMEAPGDMSMGPPRFVVGAQDADVMPIGELAAKMKGVDFRACPMTRKKIVNRVKDSHFTGDMARNSRSSAERMAVSSMSRSIWCR